jgi:hypothetical protein
MKKRFLLSEEERREISSLYSKKNIILEQNNAATAAKPVTVQDIQNKLNQFGFSLKPDNKFGPMTLSAATTAMARKDQQRKNAAATEIKSKEVTQIPTTTDAGQTTTTTTTQQAGPYADGYVLPDNNQQTPAPQLKMSQPSLIGPKTVKSEWCIQNTKREDEDCFSGSSQDYQTARSEANRAARNANYPYKRTETPKGQNPYYAIYSYQTLDNYEKKKANAPKQTTTQPAAATTNTTV